MVALVRRSGSGLIDVEKIADFINLQRFTLAEFDQHIAPINPETANNPHYRTLKADLEKLRAEYVAKATAHAPLRAEIEKLIDGEKLQASTYWNMEAIGRLADRNEQVRKELKENKDKVADIEDVMARYGIWTGALTGGAANHPVRRDGLPNWKSRRDCPERAELRPVQRLLCSREQPDSGAGPVAGEVVAGIVLPAEAPEHPALLQPVPADLLQSAAGGANSVRDHVSRRAGGADAQCAAHVEGGLVVAAGRSAVG
jgi:hypothetical protein